MRCFLSGRTPRALQAMLHLGQNALLRRPEAFTSLDADDRARLDELCRDVRTTAARFKNQPTLTASSMSSRAQPDSDRFLRDLASHDALALFFGPGLLTSLPLKASDTVTKLRECSSKSVEQPQPGRELWAAVGTSSTRKSFFWGFSLVLDTFVGEERKKTRLRPRCWRWVFCLDAVEQHSATILLTYANRWKRTQCERRGSIPVSSTNPRHGSS